MQYLRTYKQKGYTDEQLRQVLLDQGYPQANVDDSFASLNDPSPGVVQQQPSAAQGPAQSSQDQDPQVQTPSQERSTKQPLSGQSSSDTQAQPAQGSAEKGSSGLSKKKKIFLGISSLILLLLIVGAMILMVPGSEDEDDLTSSTDTSDSLAGVDEQDNQQKDTTQELVCGDCQYKEDGTCKDYVCCSDDDCSDDDTDTLDECLDPETKDSECTNTDLSSKISSNSSIDNDPDNLTNISEDENSSGSVVSDSLDFPDLDEGDINTGACTTNSSCNDGNPATKDFCEEGQCRSRIIDECIHGDGFCPPQCSYDEDDDCVEFKDGKCRDESDCDDNKTSTKDLCLKESGENYGFCDFKPITECAGGDDFCPDGCWHEDDTDCSPDNKCASDGDCDDDNDLTIDSCEGEPKICVYSFKEECDDDDGFCPYSCTDETDSDCNRTDVLNETFREECGDDVFCFIEKVAKDGNVDDCDSILNYWNDPQDYLVNTCIFEYAKDNEDEALCDDITDEAVRMMCHGSFD